MRYLTLPFHANETFFKTAFKAYGAAMLIFMCVVSTTTENANGFQGQAPIAAAEAPAAFDNMTNGFVDPGEFLDVLKTFKEDEDLDPDSKEDPTGLGPVYNGTSCVSCHQNPVVGSSSQVAVLRAGHREADPNDPNPRKVEFKEPPGGSLIFQRAVNSAIQVPVRQEDNIHTLRMATNVLGNGFVELIRDEDILKIRKSQPHGMKGLAIMNPVVISAKKGTDGKISFEYGERLGRFGWKCQDSSLLNFSAGAYLNEMGVTSPLHMEENTSGGVSVAPFDTVPMEPEDKIKEGDDPEEHLFGVDVGKFTTFMRATKAPPREASMISLPDVVEGEKIFKDSKLLGCAICHHPDFTTPPAGEPILTLNKKRGSDQEKVNSALGNKTFHPYSDFMLHDIGTGDGIVQTQHAQKPPKDVEKREKVKYDAATSEGIVRVEADAPQGNQRVLKTVAVSDDAPNTPTLDQRTANKMRTAPLWGLRVRPQMMHDGLSITIDDAIRRHKGQAEGVELKYEALSDVQKKQLIAFLKSL